MKRFVKYLLLVVIIGLIGGYIYWQYNKKRIIRESIENSIRKKTDSLYYIHYDSSKIDEINGDASFYNVSLQSDSLQEQVLKSTDSLPDALYFIKIAEVRAVGVDVAGLLQNQNVTAKKILLQKPTITILRTGNDLDKPFSYDDTLALYKKILGNFKSISADTIQVVGGTLLMISQKGKPLSTFENINITLRNFLVDSLHNYENILSYFVKDVRATVDNIQLPETKSHTRINMEKLDYDAFHRTLTIGKVQQYKVNNSTPLVDLKNIRVDSLNTDAFILRQQLRAGMLTCDGGMVTIYKVAKSKQTKNKEIELSTDFVTQAQLGGLVLGNTKVTILDTIGGGQPLVLNNVRFIVTKTVNVTEGNTLSNLISNAEWKLYSSGFTMLSKDKEYNFILDNIEVNNTMSLINIGKAHVQPLLSEAEFRQRHRIQTDRFDLTFNRVQLRGVNFKRLIGEKAIEAESGSMQALINVSNDRTLPPDPKSKVGMYPQQLLMKMKVPLYVKTLKVVDAHISYKERSVLSGEVGEVFFSRLNGTISNLTNMDEKIKADPSVRLDANGLLLGKGKISTQWQLSLVSQTGDFIVKSKLENLDALSVNPMSKPMALINFKSGHFTKLEFYQSGNDNHVATNLGFLYENMKLDVLKKEDEASTKRGVVSFLANFLLLNNNPQGGKTRTAEVDTERDIHRSFFNLIWQSVLAGAKKIGKK